MIYLVTGAAGFIGAKVCEQLLGQGHTVVGIDNLNDYYDVRLKEYRRGRLATLGNFVFRAVDIEDRPALDRLFAEFRFEAVFNLAARAGVRASMVNPHIYLTTNAHGTLNILECQRQHGVRKLVLASTSSLYAGCPMPFSESLPVNTPLSPYAASKKAAELLAYSYYKLYGLDVTVVRYFTVFGPAGRPDMSIFRFIKWIDAGQPIQLFGDGGQSRDFTYIDDIARGTILAAKPLGYEIINLGGGRTPVSLRKVIELVEASLGKPAAIQRRPFHQADITETWADISKAADLLGWQPRVGLDEGIRSCVDWHVANRDWLAQITI